MSNRRDYGYCAKCLKEKDLNPNYVHDACSGPGSYSGCAVCGNPWEDGDKRDYVCVKDLAHKAVA